GDLALANMGLGDKAAALALSELAMAAIPIEKDAKNGPSPIEILARVAAQMGEPDRAIAALETTVDTVRGRAGKRAADSCAAPARSDVRSAPEGSALPKTRRLARAEIKHGCRDYKGNSARNRACIVHRYCRLLEAADPSATSGSRVLKRDCPRYR